MIDFDLVAIFSDPSNLFVLTVMFGSGRQQILNSFEGNRIVCALRRNLSGAIQIEQS